MSDQRSNYKSAIMEVLVNLPTSALSNEAFKWVASNLPDEEVENGPYKTTTSSYKFNHDSDNFQVAIGFSPEIINEVGEESFSLLGRFIKEEQSKGDTKNSKFFEEFEKVASEDCKRLFLARGFIITYTDLKNIENRFDSKKENLPDDIQKLLDKLKSNPGVDVHSKISINGKDLTEENLPDDMPDELKKIILNLINKLKGKG